jgi:hypothetical protein
MYKLGRFPWECNACWKIFYSTQRGKRSRRRSVPAESSQPLSSQTSR